jgi:protein-S-isoprenylcysteine O-methyltransferase Ste14
MSAFIHKGGRWVVAQFVVMLGWILLTPLGHALSPSTSLRAVGGALLGVGALVGILGALVLGESRTPFPKPRDDARLIRHGIYAWIRHPLYASLIALSFGWACLWASAPGAVLALIQAVLLDAKARREEQWLREKFPGYADYAASVRRLIPWVY